ncbi:Hypothetical protein A7982_09287 [Minicystis rosea]|nr:Hypothetical protein A7982_09287 [Minicystis rosea]
MERAVKNFSSYVTAFDPSFPSRIQGATQVEIDELEAVSGHVLPTFYREFLLSMGHKDDGCLSQQDIEADVPALVSYYREAVATGEDEVPRDSIVVAVGFSIEKLCLEARDGGGLWNCDLATKHKLWAESLENWLFQWAYLKYRTRAFPYFACYSAATRIRFLEPARAEAHRRGFKEQWFSDRVTLCTETSDAVLIVQQMAHDPPAIAIAGRDASGGESFIRHLVQTTGVALQRQL